MQMAGIAACRILNRSVLTCLLRMLSPHLSSTPLGTGGPSVLPGMHSGVRLLPDPWDSNPSVVLTELRTEVSLCCDGSMLYSGSNPKLTDRFALLSFKDNRCASRWCGSPSQGCAWRM